MHKRIACAAAVAASLVIIVVTTSSTATAQKIGKRPMPVASRSGWPALAEQLGQEYLGRRVAGGTKLETLIKSNQEVWMLNPGEEKVRPLLPSWLRVWWRKGHPQDVYSADDPTGGYPHVLNEVLEWMMTHQDLQAGPGEAEIEKDGNVGLIEAFVAGPNVRVSGLQTAARSESDIRINYFDPMKVLAASNDISATGQQGVYYSVDGGSTWGQTSLPLAVGDAFHSDPTVEWTSDGKAWSSTLGINAAGSVLMLRNYVSTNNGATWTLEATPSGTQTNVDKQMVWVDHSATSPYFGRMYAIWHNGNPANMNRRTAGAAGTWLATPLTVSTGDGASGTRIGNDVKTNAFGDVFGFYPATGSRGIYVVKSTNGGDTFSTAVKAATTFDSYDIGVPSFNSRRALIYVSGGAYRTAVKNLVYASWTDLSGATGCTAAANEPGATASATCKTRVWFVRSTDGGATWGTPIKVNDQSSLNDQYNQWMVVDETNGTIGMMYYDTVADATRKKTDIWFQSSSDDGVTWSAAQKISTAQTDETISGADSGNQYGDYNGLSGYANVFFPVWTDRRNAAKEEIWTAKIATPTAAQVSLSGRVTDASGNGIRNVVVSIQDQTGGVRRSITNSFGYYSFEEVPSGTAYIVNAAVKRYTFTARVVTLVDSLSDVNFTAQP